MNVSHEATLLETCRFLREAADRLLEASTSCAQCVIDSTGAKARLDRIRDSLTQAQELVDAADGNLTEVGDRLKRCSHPKEGWKIHDDTFYTCTCCGSVWSGLKWEDHADVAKKD